ncbi:MAG TPA: hypothetical protein VFA90_00010 [Terriglobales bacterium]|nr:hypothetical protein [Terriglobales bacterium]
MNTGQTTGFRLALGYLGHLLIAVVVVPAITAACFLSFASLVSQFSSGTWLIYTHAALTIPLFPLQAVSGIAVGVLLAPRSYGFRVARWVWILPAIWWTLLIVSWSSSSVLAESRFEHYLWSGSAEAKRAQIFSTLPFVTSIAYSCGSILAAAFRKEASTNQTSNLA